MADRAFVGRHLIHCGPTNLADEILVGLFIDGLGDFFKKPGSPPLNFHEDITMLLLRLPGKDGKGDRILDSFRVYVLDHVWVKGIDIIYFVVGGFHQVVACASHCHLGLAHRHYFHIEPSENLGKILCMDQFCCGEGRTQISNASIALHLCLAAKIHILVVHRDFSNMGFLKELDGLWIRSGCP